MKLRLMLKRLCFLIVLNPLILHAQLHEDFSDGELLNNPEWEGDLGRFIVNNSFQLQLNDDAPGYSNLFTTNEMLAEMEWRCWVRQAFSPSANNHSRIYLMAAEPDTSGTPDGIFLQMGESGSGDAVVLMKQEGGDTSTLIRGTTGAIATSFKCRIKVTLEGDSWKLFVDYAGGKDFQPEGSITLHPEPGNQYLGFYCKYTISNSKKFYFDDIYAGPVLNDTLEPDIYRYDVVINEIMADPSPPESLPEYEYLELYNTTSHLIDLYGWKLIIGNSEKSLTGAKIRPGDYLIIARQDAMAELGDWGDIWGLESFSLSNAGEEITLLNHKDELISYIYYRDYWYGDADKDDGGYSLEQLNPYNPCPGAENWTASGNYSGGTPGSENSVFDLIYYDPEMMRSCVHDSMRIKLVFNQSMHTGLVHEPDIFIINGGVGTLEAILPADQWFYSFKLYPKVPLLHGKMYELTCNSYVSNCVGDSMIITENILLGIPEEPEWNDIVINEVLFDPFPGGDEYVEIYNRSEKVISLSGISIASVKHDPPSPPDTSFYVISDDCNDLVPGEYAVLCQNIQAVNNFYHTPARRVFVSFKKNLSLNNERGTILLLSSGKDLLDAFSYHESMHYPLLNSTKGISLERIHHDRPANDATNWHSASSHEAYGTPGYRNSQFLEDGSHNNPIKISPRVFTPGTDGHRDHIGIHYSFETQGLLATVMIFNSSGYLVRQLVNNELLGTTGMFSWDGICDDNSRALAGIYVIFIELVDMNGKVRRYKETAVLALNR